MTSDRGEWQQSPFRNWTLGAKPRYRDSLPHPLPWYVAGPLIGLMVPALLLLGNKAFGVSSNLRHLCAALVPGRIELFRYDWKAAGSWNLALLLGILLGAFIASQAAPPPSVALAADTVEALRQLGLHDFSGLAPREVFSWASLLTLKGVAVIVGGGFLVGFGTAYAGGCTSGHAIAGLASRQLPSLLAVCGFFAGGLAATHLLLPWLLGFGK
jgi:uncharacterized membrane protein YedE/YeeE